MTTNEPGWPPSPTSGPPDHGWGSAAGSTPDDANNPWSAASGDVGLGGRGYAATAASASASPEPDPFAPPTFPAYEPAPAAPTDGPPTSRYTVAPDRQTPYDQTPYDQTPYDQTPYDQTPYGQTSYGQNANARGSYLPNPYVAQEYGPSYPPTAAVNPYTNPSSYGYAQQPHPQAVLALVLGIVGMVPCLGLVSIPAIILGRKVLAETRQQPGRWTGGGMGMAGFVLGIIALAFGVLWLLGAMVGGFGDVS